MPAAASVMFLGRKDSKRSALVAFGSSAPNFPRTPIGSDDALGRDRELMQTQIKAISTRFAKTDFNAWGVVALGIVLQVVISGVVFSSFSFWISAWMHTFDAPRAPILITLTVALFASALISPISGYFMDRWSVRGVICIGLCFFGTGATLISIADRLWQIQVLYALGLGVGMGLAGALAAQTMTAKTVRGKRGLAFALTAMGTPLGGILIPPLLVLLLSHFDWRVVERIIAVAGFSLVPVVAAVAPISSQPTPKSANHDPAADHVVSSEWSTKQILSTLNFWIVLTVFLPTYAAQIAYAANISQIASGWGLAPKDAAFIYSLSSIMTLCCKPIVGRLADYYDPRLLLIGGYTVWAVGFLILLGSPSSHRIMAGSATIGIGSSIYALMQSVMINRYFGTRSFGRVLGLLNLFLLFGALGGPIAGAIRDAVGNYNYVLLACGVVPLLSTICLFKLKTPAFGMASE